MEGSQYEAVLRGGGIYSRVADLEQHTRHLINRREDEFGEALLPIIAAAEGVPITAVHKVGRTSLLFEAAAFED